MKLVRFLFRLIRDIIDAVLIYLPGESGVFVRRHVYSKRFRSCGNNLRVGCNVKITGFDMIDIGDNVEIKDDATILTGRPRPKEAEQRWFLDLTDYTSFEKGRIVIGNCSRISYGALILGFGGVKIGKKCAIGIGAKVISETNHYTGRRPDFMYKPSGSAPQEEQSILRGIVVLENGSTLAANAIAFPGAVIGRDSWVLPNSVVRLMGRIPSNKIAKGDPAQVIAERYRKSRSPQSFPFQEVGAHLT